MSPIAIFSGSAHPALAEEICAKLHVPLLPTRLKRFSNDCIEVQLQANCREQDVFLIQPLSSPVQDHLVELLLMLDAARGASASRITAVIPHYAYARSDKKDAPRISIGGRLVADLLATAGANRVLTMTLHSPQVHGFFSVPVDHLHALGELAQHFQRYDLTNGVVVSPDLGNAKSAAAFAKRLGVPMAAGAKERLSDTQVRISMLIGDVATATSSFSTMRSSAADPSWNCFDTCVITRLVPFGSLAHTEFSPAPPPGVLRRSPTSSKSSARIRFPLPPRSGCRS